MASSSAPRWYIRRLRSKTHLRNAVQVPPDILVLQLKPSRALGNLAALGCPVLETPGAVGGPTPSDRPRAGGWPNPQDREGTRSALSLLIGIPGIVN